MSYNQRRYETLRRLRIEQLPTLRMSNDADQDHLTSFGDLPVRSTPVSINCYSYLRSDNNNVQVPGRKCPNCAAKGQTVWVIPGKRCPQCGTQVN